VAGSAVYPGLFRLAGAAGSATGLSLRSPRDSQDLFRAAGLAPGCRLRRRSFYARWKTSSPPGPPGCPPALLRLRSLRRRNTPRTRTPPPEPLAKGSTTWTRPPPGPSPSSARSPPAALPPPSRSPSTSTAAARSAPAAQARSRRGCTTSSPRSNRWPRCLPGAPPPGSTVQARRPPAARPGVPLRRAPAGTGSPGPRPAPIRCRDRQQTPR